MGTFAVRAVRAPVCDARCRHAPVKRCEIWRKQHTKPGAAGRARRAARVPRAPAAASPAQRPAAPGGLLRVPLRADKGVALRLHRGNVLQPGCVRGVCAGCVGGASAVAACVCAVLCCCVAGTAPRTAALQAPRASAGAPCRHSWVWQAWPRGPRPQILTPCGPWSSSGWNNTCRAPASACNSPGACHTFECVQCMIALGE